MNGSLTEHKIGRVIKGVNRWNSIILQKIHIILIIDQQIYYKIQYMLLTNFMKDTASLPGVEESTRVSCDTKKCHKT